MGGGWLNLDAQISTFHGISLGIWELVFFPQRQGFRIPEVRGEGGKGDWIGGWVGREYVRYKELGMVKRGIFE